jgi:hypothetical protein
LKTFATVFSGSLLDAKVDAAALTGLCIAGRVLVFVLIEARRVSMLFCRAIAFSRPRLLVGPSDGLDGFDPGGRSGRGNAR